MDGGSQEHCIIDVVATREGARRRGASREQIMVWFLILAGLAMAIAFRPQTIVDEAMTTVWTGFIILAACRIWFVLASLGPAVVAPAPAELPRYTVLTALHDESRVAAQLIERLAGLNYPPDLLEVLILIEAHDVATLQAVLEVDRPDGIRVVVVPPGSPQTKPRALNFGLALATGTLVTIYDAEDDPHPMQLREAAARFAADSTARLACLQAPLRIGRRNETVPLKGFLRRQFAIEYAALFEVTLPAMARLGLPFPLGGTSNHFRVAALRAIGGWDDWNVTEDADLGFELWRNGWTSGVLTLPTHEAPPADMADWLPQRTRWLKGYMQTWGVHTRSLSGLGWRGVMSLCLTIGAGLVSAAAHALALGWIVAFVLVAVMAGLPPDVPKYAMSVLVVAVSAAWIQCGLGTRKRNLAYTAGDMLLGPIYWSLLTLAFAHATWRLVREPFFWDKTAHLPDDIMPSDAGRRPA